jgi:signal transduction histidine kinase
LAAILALPVAAIVVLTALSTVSAATRAGAADQAREVVGLGRVGARLAMQLQRERSAATVVFAGGSSAASVAEYQRQIDTADALIAEFRLQRGFIRPAAGLGLLADRVIDDVSALPSLRQKVQAAPDAVLSVVTFRYRSVVADLLAYRQALGQVGVSASTANGLRAVASLSQAIEAQGQLQVAVTRTLIAGDLTPAGQQEIAAADAGQAEALQTFNDLGRPAWRALLNARVGGPEVLKAERLQGLATRAQPGSAVDLGTDVQGWSSAVGSRMDLMHAVETELDAELLGDVTAERDAERRAILTQGGIVAALLLVMLVVGWAVARSLTRSLGRLRGEAMEVAAHRLPRMVAELGVDNADRATIERVVAEAAEPIPLDGSDEVGQVAAAFNLVLQAAARTAGEQAALRAAVGAILFALARRLQRRSDAMMATLDVLERAEENPDRLKRLFELDHVATVGRRLIASLQILAGGQAGRVRAGSVALPDLLRAAQQEIEQYQRVEFRDVDPDVWIDGAVADELIHLLAELLDNATSFSPPETMAIVDARAVADLLHVQISDQGTGMGVTEMDAIRDRLAHPRRLDERATRHMGLPVVGAIAERLGVTVDYRSVRGDGTRVDLTVPGRLFAREPDPQRTTPVAESQANANASHTGGTHPTPPLTWPPMPVRSRGTHSVPAIAERLRHDPSRSSFSTPVVDGDRAAEVAAVELSVVAAGWSAAHAVSQLGSGETTESGLPVRRPGQRIVPTPELDAVTRVDVQRRPEHLRQQMSSFQRGLGRAGRSVHLVVKDNGS